VEIRLKIFRFDPEIDKQPHYDQFAMEASPNDRILDCLNKIRNEQDSSLAFRKSCEHGICGSDGLTINGTAALACQKLVKDYDYTIELVVEPLKYFPVVKDLVVDMELFFQRIKSIQPTEKAPITVVDSSMKERIQSVEERKSFDDAIKCILCACCVAACPVMLNEEATFVGPAAILRAHRYIFDSRTSDVAERMQIMEKPHGIWSCKSYFKCTQVCPKKIKVTEAILKTKRKILQEFHHKSGQEGKTDGNTT
jgi:succinate dehydrogenase / fumarate reductase iron-sulfur subunit